jgi:hypothetical protein
MSRPVFGSLRPVENYPPSCATTGTGGAGAGTRPAGHGRRGNSRGRAGRVGHRLARVLLLARQGPANAAVEPVAGAFTQERSRQSTRTSSASPGSVRRALQSICSWSRPLTGCVAVWPWLPDTDPGCRFEPQLVGSADIKGGVELVEVAHDLVAAELAGRMRVGGEQPDGFIVPGLLLPGTGP